jgi:hypothetical protein
MLKNNPIKTTTGVISVASLILLSFPSIGTAQTETNSNNPDSQEESIADLVPDRRKGGASRRPQASENTENETAQAPQRRKPAASRPINNQCKFNPQELIALIPENSVGATATSSPTLYFSVPAITATTKIELVLRGPNDELVEKQTFSGQEQAGIMSLELPNVAPISTSNSDKKYHWYLSVICNEADRAYDVVVEGLLQPVTLESHVVEQLEGATIQERVKVYQSHQVWHETLSTIAQLKRSQPQNANISQQLENLLESVDLEPTIGQKPLLEPLVLSLKHSIKP